MVGQDDVQNHQVRGVRPQVSHAFRHSGRLTYLETGGLQYLSGQGAKVRVVVDYQHARVGALDRGGLLGAVAGNLSGHILGIGPIPADLSRESNFTPPCR
jgi:hypothetical protein